MMCTTWAPENMDAIATTNSVVYLVPKPAIPRTSILRAQTLSPTNRSL
eukprot:CAMPEP_0114623338 /NCGR_PEP_ID=MMETSP0168-20121206/10194_1 /TAXON_ID=95228 ORGANISM="Vannella sp., Strain DIVA3 517/6/12" /NCGR_SAMPLE_ID=MMETSP0168 /ASSEMBLY_ACC=CAM_ASM_000044 /LENGTH=47 /DNA_ID= /DNA_START= /DNA_END= /DNA_ORIENTATION=